MSQLGTLLDPTAAELILSRSLPPETHIDDLRIRFVDYVPSVSLGVRYEVDLGGELHEAVATISARNLAAAARLPQHIALANVVDGRSPATAALSYEADLDVLVSWLPLDLALPALAEPPTRLARKLRAAGVTVPAAEPQRIGYRQGLRAVLRLGDSVLKAYAEDSVFRAALAGGDAISRAGIVPTPAPLGQLPALRLTAQTAVAGRRIDRTEAPLLADTAGEILRALHDSAVAPSLPAPPHRQLAEAAVSAAVVSAVVPPLAPRVEALLAWLRMESPDAQPSVPSHGDFNVSQLLLDGDRLWVLDFDELCYARPALDLASYAANLVGGREGDLVIADAALTAVCDGYGRRPAGIGWFLAALILRRSSNPFRLMKSRWPARVESMISAAEAVRTW